MGRFLMSGYLEIKIEDTAINEHCSVFSVFAIQEFLKVPLEGTSVAVILHF